ncbi:MAG: prephenate dehydrogenase/arogenate dehydrogenase family protein [Spirochaetaceae bacterium]|nr:prephenate dehydrogenase/arogenate dehydrogenase family protein [Spirochaetaceae bacterium]
MNVGVYGLGRFGIFWAQELARHNNNVIAYSRSIKDPLYNIRIVSEEEVLSAPILFICVSISSFESVLTKIAPKIKPGTIVIDTCSVKIYPSKIMKKLLPFNVYCIASHPMFGPDSGKDGLANLPMVIYPLNCPPSLYKEVYDEFSKWDLHLLEMSPDSHDREAAWSQGITHFVGRVLDELALQPTALATTGYNRLMSIVEQTCNDPLQLFYDLQRYNPYAKQMIMGLKGSLDYVMQELTEQEQ